MTTGEKLLDLTIEYAAAKDDRENYASLPGAVVSREPSVIAADYEDAIRELLAVGAKS